jgi:hypothetical protein
MGSAFADRPYDDPNITRPVTDPPLTPVAIEDNPAKNHNPAQVDVYDVEGRQTDGFVHTDAPPHKPTHWPDGRDVYANGGTPNQEFFENQGD